MKNLDMFPVGCWNCTLSRSVECYDFKEDRWNHLRLQWFRSTNHSFDACLVLSEMPGRRCRCGVAVVRGRVYGVGGFNGSLRVRKIIISVMGLVILVMEH